MEKCKRLEEYSIFIDKIRKYAKNYPERLDLAITKAIEDCIAEDVLKDFLIERKSEVLEMILYSFDKELYEEDLKQVAFEEGERNGEKGKLISQIQKKLAKQKTVTEIAEELEEDVTVIQQIIDSLN